MTPCDISICIITKTNKDIINIDYFTEFTFISCIFKNISDIYLQQNKYSKLYIYLMIGIKIKQLFKLT